MKRKLVRAVWSTIALGLSALIAAAGPAEVERVFSEIVNDAYQENSPPKRHRLVESDLNAFIALRLREQRPPGVQEMVIGLLAENRLSTRMLVDVDELGISNNSGVAGWLGSLMSGTQRLEFQGLLSSGAGLARYQIESVRLNGFPIPVSLVESLLQRWGRQIEPPIDFSEPFQLPYRIQEIQITQGEMTVHTGGISKSED